MPTKAQSFAQRRGRQRQPDYRESAARRGYDRVWQAARLWHLQHNPLCVFCGCSASIVDHKTPLNDGGARLAPDNFRSVCVGCNAVITGNYRASGVNEPPEGWKPG